MSDGAATPRQEELLSHALALVQEVGLGGLTVRRLADRVGFTEAALYRHFPNKQALLLALVTRLSEERLLVPIRALAAADTPARQRLEGMIRHHLRTVLELEGFPILVMAEAASAGDEPLLDRFRRVMAELLGIFEGLLGELPPDPGRPPTRLLAMMLFGPAAFSALHQRLAGPGFDAQLVAELPPLLVERLVGAGSPLPSERPR